MAKKTKTNGGEPTKFSTLKERVQAAVLRVWQQIAADASTIPDGASDLDVMVELCLDADRPVTLGGLIKEDYTVICAMGPVESEDVDNWAREVLKPYVE